MAWTEITDPAVGAKITAAGFGLQVDTAIDELQNFADSLGTIDEFDVGGARNWSAAGREVPSISGGTPVSCPAGTTTVVTAPASGRRVIKWLFVNAPTNGMTVKLTLATKDMTTLSFSTAGVWSWDVAWPLTSSDTLTATVAGGTATITAGYGDRSATDVTRLGFVSSSGSGTLVASGTSRVITHLWMGNPSTTTSATGTIAVGGVNLLTSLPVSSTGFYELSDPLPVGSSQAVTYAGDGVTALTFLAVGR